MIETAAGGSATGGVVRRSQLRFAEVIVPAFLGGLGVLSLLVVLDADESASSTLLGGMYLAVVIAVQLLLFGRGGQRPSATAAVAGLLVQIVAVSVPYLHFDGWSGMPGVLVACVLLVFPARAAIAVSLCVVVSIAAATALLGAPPDVLVFQTVTTAFTGLTLYGLTRLVGLVRTVYAARGELIDVAIADQRVRFAAELQAVLGQRLSVIKSRCERIIADSKGVSNEGTSGVEELLSVTREALTEVRSVAKDGRRVELDEELASAANALQAASVRPRIRAPSVARVSEPLGTVLAAVVREGVTNVLRHSCARWCAVSLDVDGDDIVLEVVNDGASSTAGAGFGLQTLERRVANLGGELESAPDRDGTYRLRVNLPSDTAHVEDAGRVPRRAAVSGSGVSQRLAKVVLAIVLCGFGILAVTNILVDSTGTLPAVVSFGYLAALVALQLLYFGQSRFMLRSRVGALALVAQGLLVFGPIVQFGTSWLDMPGFLAGGLLLTFRSRAAIPLAAAVVIVVGTIAFAGYDYALPAAIGVALSTAITGLVVFGLTWLARLAGQLHETRRQLARKAVAEEKLRFARDVHDLMGLSLSAIALKAELANRLLATQPDTAREQLAEIVQLSRKAFGDVRSVASGYQQLSLEEELASAETVLASAEIDVERERSSADLSSDVNGVLATVVREGVTNVLRHSKAEWCRIRLVVDDDTALLEVTNDGVTADGEDGGQDVGGNGLGNLTHRVRQVGGTVSGQRGGDGTFLLRATAPLTGQPVTSSRPPSRS